MRRPVLALIGLLGLAACQSPGSPAPPRNAVPPPPAAPVAVDRGPAICTLVAFYVDGRAAGERTGFAGREARAVLTQKMRERGFRTVDPGGALRERFERRVVELETSFGMSQVMVSPDRIVDEVRETVRKLLLEGGKSGSATTANCPRVLTGVVAVGATTPDSATAGYQAPVMASLEIIDAFTLEDVASGYKSTLEIDTSPDLAIRSALQSSLEAVVSGFVLMPMSNDGPYTVDVDGTGGRRELSQVHAAMIEQGMQVQDCTDNHCTIAFPGGLQAFEQALNRALDQLQARYPRLDYTVKGKAVRVCLQGCNG